MDNVFDLENCDSGLSSIRSSYRSSFGGEPCFTDMDSCAEKVKSLSLGPKSPNPQHTNLERLPSVDEGFVSGLTESFNSISQDKPLNIEYGNTDIDEQILDIFVQDEDGDTKLHMAIIQLVPSIARQMINMCPDPFLLNLTNNLEQTPLHLAVLTKQAEIVRRLICMGACLETRDRHGNTALHLACREGDLSCVLALTAPLRSEELAETPYKLEPQAIPQNMDIWNYDGVTCLHLAVTKGHHRIVAHLTSPSVQANINAKDGRSGRTVLHYAVEAGDLDLTKFLILNCSANVNALTFDGSSPLKLAAGRGFHQGMQLLQAFGADHGALVTSDESDSSESEDDMIYDDIQIGGKPVGVV